jgi:ribonuclease BN (tRNA processing enzyme)
MDRVKVTILGSGTYVPSLVRNSPSLLVEIGENKLLFDLGVGTMRRLLEKGIGITEISHIFLSHLHPDHTGELVSFIFASKYPPHYRRRSLLTLIGAAGLTFFYDGLRNVYGDWIDLGDNMLKIIELSNSSPDSLSLGFADIYALPMAHTENSIGYRLETSGGITIVYTGDTDYCRGVVDLSMNADLLVCESALPDGMKVDGHLTPSIAGRIATEAEVKHLVLNHFYPECEGVDIEQQCRKTYAGQLTLGRDLLEIEM